MAARARPNAIGLTNPWVSTFLPLLGLRFRRFGAPHEVLLDRSEANALAPALRLVGVVAQHSCVLVVL
eukprot:934940-Pyramimonas_sp.AAC.1